MFQFIYIHWKSESIKNGFWDSPSSWLTMQKEKDKNPGNLFMAERRQRTLSRSLQDANICYN